MPDSTVKPEAAVLIHVVGAAILRDGRCLAARRAAHVRNPSKWEFPGGKVEAGEDPRAALEREIEEELGWRIRAGELLGRGQAADPHGRRIVLDVYLAELAAGQPLEPSRLVDHDEVRWIALDETGALDWAEADLPLLPLLAFRMGG